MKIYLNSYLELEKTNLVTLLSFNSDAISEILKSENKEQFPSNALIYKVRMPESKDQSNDSISEEFSNDDEDNEDSNYLYSDTAFKQSAVDIAL